MEERIILTEKNCHRAKAVRLIDQPNTIYHFGWREKRISNNWFKGKWEHILVDENQNQINLANTKEELAKYEVIDWKYKENFEDLWELAVRAFNATSFDPEERGAQMIREFETELQSVLKSLSTDEDKAIYIVKYKDYLRELLVKHSRILSPMITGPARFPTARNEKAIYSYNKTLTEFKYWRERARKAILKKQELSKTPEQRADDEWMKVKKDIIDTAETVMAIDQGTYHGTRSLFVSNLYNRMVTVAKQRKKDIVLKAFDLVRDIATKNNSKPLFTARHKFWKLIELSEQVTTRIEERRSKGQQKLPFDGGEIIKNFEEDRLQIIFDSKPSYDKIKELKQNGFRWSPRFGAWQRQLSLNSYYSCARVLPVTVEQIKLAHEG